jgi:hypothetical protein
MRTTVRIDDDLVHDLKERARREKLSLNRLLNLVLRRGLKAGGPPRVRHREKPADMGPPLFNIDKALAVAAALEDEQIIAKLAARK